MMRKSAMPVWLKFLEPLLRPTGRKAVQQLTGQAARDAAVAAAKAVRPVHNIAIEKPLESLTTKTLEAAGLRHLVGKSGKTVRRGLRGASPEVRKAVSKAFTQDMNAMGAELERLGHLRKGTTDPDLLKAIQSRIEYVGARQKRLAGRASAFKQTGWDRTKRGLGLAASLGFGGLEAYEAVDNLRQGNYANAAYHAAMAPLFGLGSVAGAAGRGLRGIRGLKSLGRGLEAAARPFETMEFAGRYGRSGNGVTRWMLRHPILASEAIGTPLGADTMISSFTKPSGESEVGFAQMGEGSGNDAWYYRGTPITVAEARRLQGMPDDQLIKWLRDNVEVE